MRLKLERVCAACLIWVLPSLGVHAAGEEGYELAFSTYVGRLWPSAVFNVHGRGVLRHGAVGVPRSAGVTST